MSNSIIKFRPYQQAVFNDRSSGIHVLFWGRQTGKSFTIAAWAVDRLLTRPGRLVTILSNSRDNGAELNLKCAEICRMLGEAFEQEDLSPDVEYENMNMETRITVGGKVGRIKVLAANPRTARGFSGDLILDEFAFHEDSYGIWEAAEPILSSNPDYLCLVSSTPNGTHNMFYEMVTCGIYKVTQVRRSDAYEQGLKIYHPVTREPISPEEARALALDKRAYDQNYELVFADENAKLLTNALITAAESDTVGVICEQEWTDDAILRMVTADGPLYFGLDVGRNRDISVLDVAEKFQGQYLVRATLRMENMRLPRQQDQLRVVCRMNNFRRGAIDMTGIGLGLCEYAQDEFGAGRIMGVQFSSTVPMSRKIRNSGRKEPTVKITEHMAIELLSVYEDRIIRHPYDQRMREDLRKPEKVVSSGGRVSIAASRDSQDHADHFWGKALMIHAAENSAGPFRYQSVDRPQHRERAAMPRRGVLL